jgi:putative DNA methylase
MKTRASGGNAFWRNRGYLPHFEGGEIAQTITFRLHGSLPMELLLRWKDELLDSPESKRDTELRSRIEKHLDSGVGSRWLADDRMAQIVASTLARFDGERYLLHAWVVMPNHVHALFTPKPGFTLSSIVHSWKSYTAKEAKKRLGLDGKFCQAEYFDRAIRDARHFALARAYIEDNPVNAGLVNQSDEWQWSSASASGGAGDPPA